MKASIIVAFAGLIATAASADTINPGFSLGNYQAPSRQELVGARSSAQQMRYAHWRIEVIALRREALELQQRDGGTLNEEHRSMLQAKLDRINARFRAAQ